MKLFLSALMIAVLSFAPSLAHAAASIVGKVLEVEGSAQITDANGQTYDAEFGTPVHAQDILTTGPKAKLYIQFIDNTEFTLSENAQFTVEEYNFNEKDASKNYATYSVLEGAFLYVSGLVAKKKNPDVKVNIPQGSIGIRGTKFWGGMVDGKYGVIVGEGKVTVKNKAGSATLIKGQGTTLLDRVTKPEAPKKWTPEKIARATATVTLKDPSIVGARMIEARKEQAELRAEHVQAQADVARVDPAVLEERVEQKILMIHPEMRPDLQEEEAKAKAEEEAKAKADAEAAKAKEDDDDDLRDRLKQDPLNSVDQSTMINRLNSTETTVETTVKETATSPTSAV
ncbi:MAG TPA: FecR domain-containing protein, partial [Alphaproteobacteria bacterium]